MGELDHGKPDFKVLFSIQESAAAIQNMLLTAHEEGLGACWNGSFEEERVSEVLRIPKNVRSIAIISIGYPAETKRPPGRKHLEQVLHYEKY